MHPKFVEKNKSHAQLGSIINNFTCMGASLINYEDAPPSLDEIEQQLTNVFIQLLHAKAMVQHASYIEQVSAQTPVDPDEIN